MSTKDAISPFTDAKQEWLERYGSYITRAAQWRMFAFICLAITGLPPSSAPHC